MTSPVSWIAVGVLAITFLWAALHKILAPDRWKAVLDRLGFSRPTKAIGLLVVPWAELGIVVFFAVGWRRVGAALALLLLVPFCAVLIRIGILLGEKDVPCACFGGTARRDWRVLVARNAVLLVAALLLVLGRGSWAPDSSAIGYRLPVLMTWIGVALLWSAWQLRPYIGERS
jgi:hypothetical protein